MQRVGSGAGRESSKQETGSAEHHSRATRNGARAKNSSRAALSAGQPLFGWEGALPPPEKPLGHGPHIHHEPLEELPGSHGAGLAIREEEPRRGSASGELSKHCEEQKQLRAEGCDPCQRGMGTGRRLSQPQESRGPGCLPCPLQGVEAACAPMGNSQPLGDRGPPGTTSWAPRAPQQPAARSVISEPRGQGYGEASLCCPRSAEPPSPRPLTGKRREAEAHI